MDLVRDFRYVLEGKNVLVPVSQALINTTSKKDFPREIMDC